MEQTSAALLQLIIGKFNSIRAAPAKYSFQSRSVGGDRSVFVHACPCTSPISPSSHEPLGALGAMTVKKHGSFRV